MNIMSRGTFIPIDSFVDVSEFVKALPQQCLAVNILPPLRQRDGISGSITGLATGVYIVCLTFSATAIVFTFVG